MRLANLLFRVRTKKVPVEELGQATQELRETRNEARSLTARIQEEIARVERKRH